VGRGDANLHAESKFLQVFGEDGEFAGFKDLGNIGCVGGTCEMWEYQAALLTIHLKEFTPDKIGSVVEGIIAFILGITHLQTHFCDLLSE